VSDEADISSEGLYTAQEYTLQFGTNVLGHQALIHHLLPVLLSSSARVLLLSSAGHAAAPRGGVDYRSVVRDPRDPNDPKNPVKGRYEVAKWAEYGQAKWGDIALARYLHAKYGPGSGRTGQELLCFSMHPGEFWSDLAD
jgi:NAD(P)-dependent dehydrogenase (short-subunit alcohol dehydrogenase family)